MFEGGGEARASASHLSEEMGFTYEETVLPPVGSNHTTMSEPIREADNAWCLKISELTHVPMEDTMGENVQVSFEGVGECFDESELVGARYDLWSAVCGTVDFSAGEDSTYNSVKERSEKALETLRRAMMGVSLGGAGHEWDSEESSSEEEDDSETICECLPVFILSILSGSILAPRQFASARSSTESNPGNDSGAAHEGWWPYPNEAVGLFKSKSCVVILTKQLFRDR